MWLEYVNLNDRVVFVSWADLGQGKAEAEEQSQVSNM